MQLDSLAPYTLRVLDKQLTEQHLNELVDLLNLIPLVSYTKTDVLAESKGSRVLYGKWDHSLALFDGDKLIAVVIGYEREQEHNPQYPTNCIYISELAVNTQYQRKGVARGLLQAFLHRNATIGLKYLTGELLFQVQTNRAESNKPVQKLYKELGFVESARKDYPNRTDMVLSLRP